MLEESYACIVDLVIVCFGGSPLPLKLETGGHPKKACTLTKVSVYTRNCGVKNPRRTRSKFRSRNEQSWTKKVSNFLLHTHHLHFT